MDELVIMKDRRAVTTSLLVAKKFDKEHRVVLKAIDDLKEGLAQKYADLFWEDSYVHPQNKQPYRMIYMNRDGFTLAAFGFSNNEKVLDFKLDYIKAFNKMEAALMDSIKDSYMIDDPVKRAERWIVEKQETLLLMEINAVNEQKLAEYEPKITYLDKILDSKDTMTITQIAADYGMSGQEINKILWEHGVQRKVGGQWILYRRHMNNGYTKSKTIPKESGTYYQTRWTQKGRLYIHNLLEFSGYIAVMDNNQIEMDVR